MVHRARLGVCTRCGPRQWLLVQRQAQLPTSRVEMALAVRRALPPAHVRVRPLSKPRHSRLVATCAQVDGNRSMDTVFANCCLALDAILAGKDPLEVRGH